MQGLFAKLIRLHYTILPLFFDSTGLKQAITKETIIFTCLQRLYTKGLCSRLFAATRRLVRDKL